MEAFDPNGPGMKNGNFIGLPFSLSDAELVLLPVPWDTTVSYNAGTAAGPENILQASTQLDLMDADSPDAWKAGIFFEAPNPYWQKRNAELRPKAAEYIEYLEHNGILEGNRKMQQILEEINQSSINLNSWVENQSEGLLRQGKLLGLIGGEHSVPLGYLKALAKHHASFGILQIDAHMDLRKSYEGFNYSHASIAYNILQEVPQVSKLVQVGIRDYCQAEVDIVSNNPDRIKVFYDHSLKENRFKGINWYDQVQQIIEHLPQMVYISFDIDGLQAPYCPNTGTPVPGGLSFEEAIFLCVEVVKSGRQLIGFDLVEVAGPPHEWDANVGARIVYKLAGLLLSRK